MTELDKEIVDISNKIRDKSTISVVDLAFVASYFRQAYLQLLETADVKTKEEEIQKLKYLLKSMTP